MPIVDQEKCVIRHNRIRTIQGVSSLFCASFKPGLGVCKGDDGAGFMFEKMGKFYVRGIIALGIGYQNEVICDSKHFIAVTDIMPFISWIKQNL